MDNDEALSVPYVLLVAPKRELTMMEALLHALQTFTMVSDAEAKIRPVNELAADALLYQPPGDFALVMRGWVRRYSNGTLTNVRLAAEFFVMAWRLRDQAEEAAAQESERLQLETFNAQRVVRRRTTFGSGKKALECYVRRTGRDQGAMLDVPRKMATVFKSEAEAHAFCEKHLGIVRLIQDQSWDEVFMIEPADRVPGSWAR